MGIETADKISELDPTWPPGTDKKSEGDDHLRLIKKVLQDAFDDEDADDGTKQFSVSVEGRELLRLLEMATPGPLTPVIGPDKASPTYSGFWLLDADGKERFCVRYNLTSGAYSISSFDAAGAIVNVLALSTAGTYVQDGTTGGVTTPVLTVANRGPFQGGANTDTVYPIGHQVWVAMAATAAQRNSVVTVHLHASDLRFYQDSGAGGAMRGNVALARVQSGGDAIAGHGTEGQLT